MNSTRVIIILKHFYRGVNQPLETNLAVRICARSISRSLCNLFNSVIPDSQKKEWTAGPKTNRDQRDRCTAYEDLRQVVRLAKS